MLRRILLIKKIKYKKTFAFLKIKKMRKTTTGCLKGI